METDRVPSDPLRRGFPDLRGTSCISGRPSISLSSFGEGRSSCSGTVMRGGRRGESEEKEEERGGVGGELKATEDVE